MTCGLGHTGSVWLPSAPRGGGSRTASKGVTAMLCVVCEWKHARRNRRCHTCANYRDRTGRDRPEHLLIREGRRLVEQQMSVA